MGEFQSSRGSRDGDAPCSSCDAAHKERLSSPHVGSLEATWTQLRPLRLSDARVVAALDREMFSAEAWPRALFEEELMSPWAVYLGIWAGEELVAYGGIKGDQEADLMTLAVVPQWRRKGLAVSLCTALIQEAKTRGVQSLILEVRASNYGAIKLYEQLGFKSVGTIGRYYRDPVEDAGVMRLEL